MIRALLTTAAAGLASGAAASCAPQYQWRDDVIRAAHTYRIEPALMLALITQESQWCPTAVSPAGARGLGQLMPGTARDMGVSDAFHPVQNAYGSARYLRLMLNQFGRVDVALAAYNAGPATVRQAGGIPNIPETRQHVQKVLAYYAAFKPGPRPTLPPPATPIFAQGRPAPSPVPPPMRTAPPPPTLIQSARPALPTSPAATPATSRPAAVATSAAPAPTTLTPALPTPQPTTVTTLVIRSAEPDPTPESTSSTTVIRPRN